MQPRHKVSRAAIELIKTFEGFRARAARLPNGRWTIGYGHTLTAREGAQVSESDAEALLIYDLIAVSHEVNERVFAPLTRNQFDALCAFAFSIGLGEFRTSTVLRLVNSGQMLQAACAMELWRRAPFEGEEILVDGIVRRRAAEKVLFLTPADGFEPVPSPVLPPRLDIDSTGLVPRQVPASLATSLDGDLAVAERRPEAAAPTAPERPSAVAQAAENVTARLRSLFPDDVAAEAAPAPEAVRLDPIAAALGGTTDAPAPAAPEPLPPVEPEPLPEALAAPVKAPGASEMVAALEQALPPPPPAAPLVVAQPVPAPQDEGLAPLPAPAPPSSLDRITNSPLTLAILLVGVGVLMFGGGLFWAAAADDGTGVFNPWVVGWLSCLGGASFIAGGVYLLLLRLGHVDLPESLRRRD